MHFFTIGIKVSLIVKSLLPNISNLLASLIHSKLTRNLLFHGFMFSTHEYHACFGWTTSMCKKYELMKEWFSCDFYYQIMGWEVCDKVWLVGTCENKWTISCHPKQIEITPIYNKVSWQNITHETKTCFHKCFKFHGRKTNTYACLFPFLQKGLANFLISSDGFL